MERIVKACAEVVGGPPDRSPQVGAADVSDKQRVSRKHRVRFCRILLEIEDQNRNRLDGVAGSFEDLEAQSRKLQRIAVLHRHERIFRLSAGAEIDGRAATVPQFQMAGHEIGVKVGQEDVADLQAEFLGIGQVLLDIALRVDDDRGRAGLVSDQIGSVCQATQIVLFQDHGSLLYCQPLRGHGTNQCGSRGLNNAYSQVPASALAMATIITVTPLPTSANSGPGQAPASAQPRPKIVPPAA